ncbi:UNVERIFIED_CONTAM: ABC-type glycerol-3-phosphate transport system substrate-binding protein [Acetivibrio alkalicellulosi]
MNKQYIKKGAAVVLSVLMTASLLVGCRDSGGDTPTPTPTPADTGTDVGNNGDNGEEKELTGKLSFAHFNEHEASELARAFMDRHPGVEVDVRITVRDNDAYVTAITSDIRSGADVPDVFAAEAADVKRLVNFEGGYEDLSAAPYNAETFDSKLLPFTIDIGRSNDGKIRALSHQGTPAAIGYKRTLAREHLGTDDPKDIAEMFSTPERMMQTAQTLGAAGVNIFPSWGELMRMYLGARSQPWVVDGKLVIDDKVNEMIDLVKEFRDNGYEGGMRAWTPQWSAAINDEENFAWAIPTWGLRWIIVSGMEDEEANPMATAGEWGLAEAPTPYSWGGTWFGMYSGSNNKELAWEFIKFLTIDEEQAEKHARASGDFTSNLAVIEKLANDDSFLHPLINQNPYAFYLPMVDSFRGELLTQYDGTIEDAFQNAMDSYLAGNLDRDGMFRQFKNQVKDDFPEIDVD